MFVRILQKCMPYLNIATFYALIEKKNSASFLLKTKWLMKRQLVEGTQYGQGQFE
jgi:hypothetical protein